MRKRASVSSTKKYKGFTTKAVHIGQDPDPVTGAVIPPIHATSTYIQEEFGVPGEYVYSRSGNPTRRNLEANLAALENADHAVAFASGTAAVDACLRFLGPDDHVVCSESVYGGTYRLFEQVLDRYRLAVSWVDTTDIAAVESALRPETRLLFVETPTNPMMDVTDIRRVADAAHGVGALVAVDNTFLSPCLQRPLSLGADIVVHSTTKFLNGHSDSIGGVLISSRQEDADWFAFLQKSVGAILSPFDSFLTLRGIQTLDVRMQRHEENTRAIAAQLEAHPEVGKVHYPGLADHPGHELQKRQASGFGALIAFDLGTYERACVFLDAVKVLTLAESLGGVQTLVSHPASMTHAAVPPAELEKLGIGPGLVRVSVGIEDLADLEADIEQALAAL